MRDSRSDENLFHISYEAGILEDPDTTPPADMWKLTTAPEDAPAEPERLSIEFTKGLPTKVTLAATGATHTDAVDVFDVLNALARKHGVGRIDIVENRFIGVKSRGCYESPAATILRVAHMDIEGMTLDRNVRALRDQFITTALSQILYNGYFFSPEREFVTAAIPASQRTVNGVVRLKLYKGNVVVEGRSSDEVSRGGLAGSGRVHSLTRTGWAGPVRREIRLDGRARRVQARGHHRVHRH